MELVRLSGLWNSLSMNSISISPAGSNDFEMAILELEGRSNAKRIYGLVRSLDHDRRSGVGLVLLAPWV